MKLIDKVKYPDARGRNRMWAEGDLLALAEAMRGHQPAAQGQAHHRSGGVRRC